MVLTTRFSLKDESDYKTLVLSISGSYRLGYIYFNKSIKFLFQYIVQYVGQFEIMQPRCNRLCKLYQNYLSETASITFQTLKGIFVYYKLQQHLILKYLFKPNVRRLTGYKYFSGNLTYQDLRALKVACSNGVSSQIKLQISNHNYL